MHLKDHNASCNVASSISQRHTAYATAEENNLQLTAANPSLSTNLRQPEETGSSNNNNNSCIVNSTHIPDLTFKEDNGNLTSLGLGNPKLFSSALSLLDLSESDSYSSDRAHHFSLSSGDNISDNLVSESCSLASLDNEESDFESYCSFDTEFKNDLKLIRAGCDSGCSSGYDSQSLGHLSRPSSAGARASNSFYSDISNCSPNIPDPSLNVANNNINQTEPEGTETKKFYSVPKVSLSSQISIKSDNNGNVDYSPVNSEYARINKSFDHGNCLSDDDNSIDIEHKLAETIVKMNDAILSNGREEIDLQNQKIKEYCKEKELTENAIDIDEETKSNINNQNNTEDETLNNNNINFKNHQADVIVKETTETPEDNRYASPVPESPIVDAYEKECLDVPEKMVKELEKENPEKEDEQPVIKREKIFKFKKNKDNDALDCEKEGDDSNSEADDEFKIIKDSKRNSRSSLRYSDHRKSHHVTFSMVDDVCVRRRQSPVRRRDRATFRRSVPQIGSTCPNSSQRSRLTSPDLGEFDVYTMETALPKIDWDAFEAHMNANKEEERRRNDREEIRRKLAMGVDDEQPLDRPGRKPSLQSRLQSGMNLQICFMNETASDCESQCSDTESTQDRKDEGDQNNSVKTKPIIDPDDAETADFFNQQAQLQAEARMALAQAKEMARMQMEIEKQSKKKSPIADIVRESFNKVGFPFPDKRRMSRHILTDMNVAQLQVIVNDFHTQIECLNEELVKYLLERDDLHMEQDSMLVDIEDLTKHLSARERIFRSQKDISPKESTGPLIVTPSPTSKQKASKMRALVLK